MPEIETTSTKSSVVELHSQFEFKPKSPKPIYHVLRHHQITEDSWDVRGLVQWLQEWTNRFDSEFKLRIEKVALRIDRLNAHRLGHYRNGLNGFGLAGEIAINRLYLDREQPWQILGTLLHELIHAWQEQYGKPGKSNYHNKQFREKAWTVGLIINTRGQTHFAPQSKFFDVLNRHGVEVPEFPPVQYIASGSSKLKKWSCQCKPKINVRVAVAHFHARCLWCGCEFQQATSASNAPSLRNADSTPFKVDSISTRFPNNH